MKTKTIILSLLLPFMAIAQNGIESFDLPPTHTSLELRHKNDIHVDPQGNIWVAFKDVGLAKFNGTYWTISNDSTGFPFNEINAIIDDDAGEFHVATSEGLVDFNGLGGWTVRNTTNSDLPSDVITALAKSGATLFIGTDKGLAVDDGSITVFNSSNSGLTSDAVTAVATNSSGDIFVGTDAGLFQKSGTQWTSFTESNSNLTDNAITCLQVKGDVLWVGTKSGGLHQLKSNSLQTIEELFPHSVIDFPKRIYSITVGQNGGILFSEEGKMIEVLDDQANVFYLDGGVTSGQGMHIVKDPSSSLIWMVKKVGHGSSNLLFSFDMDDYDGFGKGLTDDNFKRLDINDVSAGMLNRGDMHWDLNMPAYEVPKGSGKNAVFSSALWIGGIDAGGELHQAAMTYRQSGGDFWPGPLDTTSAYADSVTASEYDKIWKVNRFDIEEFKYMFATGAVQSGAYEVADDILDWPAHGDVAKNHDFYLAPFVDVNGNGLYDPLNDGDYPKIKGDQMLFWIFNDQLSYHTETGGIYSLGVEVHASAYAFTCPDIADSNEVLNYTTLYNYKVINRTPFHLNDTYIGIYKDIDLGYYLDDFVGCIPEYNYGFAYNGSNVDGSSAWPSSYGLNPPMVSTVVLDGPLADLNDGLDNDNDGELDEVGEKNLMSKFVYYNNDFSNTGNPDSAIHYYNYLRGRYKDGTPITDCDNSPNHMFAGFPYDSTNCSEWSQGHTPADKRFLISAGPFTLQGLSTVNLDYAVVYSRDESAPNGLHTSVKKNHEDVLRVQRWFADDSFPSCLKLNVGMEEELKEEKLLSVFPNPAKDQIIVPGDVDGTFTVLDMRGRMVIAGTLNPQRTINIQHLPEGMFLLQVTDGTQQLTSRFVKQ